MKNSPSISLLSVRASEWMLLLRGIFFWILFSLISTLSYFHFFSILHWIAKWSHLDSSLRMSPIVSLHFQPLLKISHIMLISFPHSNMHFKCNMSKMKFLSQPLCQLAHLLVLTSVNSNTMLTCSSCFASHRSARPTSSVNL